MDENKIFENNKEISIEKRSLDVYVINGDIEKLKKVGVAICTELQRDSMIRPVDQESFFAGEKQRPGGVIAVYFTGGKLFVQNVNGVGNKQYQDQLETVVNNALK